MQRSTTLCHDRVDTRYVTSLSMVLYPHIVLIISVWKENNKYKLQQKTKITKKLFLLFLCSPSSYKSNNRVTSQTNTGFFQQPQGQIYIELYMILGRSVLPVWNDTRHLNRIYPAKPAWHQKPKLAVTELYATAVSTKRTAGFNFKALIT